jgi:hypothetical protein
MIIRALNDNGDWTFGNGKGNYLRNNKAIRQNLETRLLEHKYDWFNDEEKGIDYNYYLSSKGVSNDLENAIRYTILSTEDVTGITSFNTESKDRLLKIQFAVNTIYGTTLNINITL